MGQRLRGLALWCSAFGAAASPAGCPPEVARPEAAQEGHCAAFLPPLAPAASDKLLRLARELIEGRGTVFPFTTPGVGFDISQEEAEALDEAVLRRAESPRMPVPSTRCKPHTYGDNGVDILAGMFLPGGRGELSAADVLIDLGAGIAKVMAVAALTSNASARGIELSAERHAEGCKVLRLLESTLANDAESLVARAPGLATACPASRRLDLWRGDLLEPPPELLEPPPPSPSGEQGALTFFAYTNCFPTDLIAMMMRMVAGSPHPCARLLISKTLARGTVEEGLRRQAVRPAMYTLFGRDGDRCRAPMDPGNASQPTEAAMGLGWPRRTAPEEL